MPNTSLSPVSVVQYHRDYIIELVRYITGWKERSEVSSKDQLHYICSYLEVDHINCQTIVVESEYIERHYLEDFAEYYARCFRTHPRTCSRLHFFSIAFTDSDFNKCLRNEDDSITNQLRKSYIGFAVLRPIPHTVFARVCLRPYEALIANSNCKILTRKVQVSLFGLNLTVDTIPFLEQDRVVSACATSALWVALSTDPDMSLNDLPSPSAITKSATTGGIEATRIFPTAGLSPPQMLRGLRHYGLEPSILWGGNEQIDDLKAQIYSYLSNDTAVIVGGDIFRKREDGAERLGSHLVCVTGFALDDQDTEHDGKVRQRLLSDLISKFYVHDDRSGPYLRLFTKLMDFSFEGKTQRGLEMSVVDRGEFYFVPSIAIVGLYHKIRIPYATVQAACSALYKYLFGTRSDLSSLNRTGSKQAKARDGELVKYLDTLLNGYWEISLTTSNHVKQDLMESNDFISFNGLSNKIALLVRNMPKYVWRCRIIDKLAPGVRHRIADILFDATEVPQGEIVVGIISYTFEVQEIWNYVEECVRGRIWQSWRTDDPDAEEAVRCFIRFFTQDGNNSYLNAHYGPLGLPRRSLKRGETDQANNISLRGDVFTIRRGETPRKWSILQTSKKYIWVINEMGDIVIGEDVDDDNGFKGHPTLIDGKPGRIAGELAYKRTVKKWEINLKSRAYSGHVESDERARYLAHVIELNLPGLPVIPDASSGSAVSS